MGKGVATTIYLPGPYSQANTKILQVNPTLAVGDAKYSDLSNGGALTNLATPPDVYPAGGSQLRFQFSAAEFNNEPLVIYLKDAAGAEWCDQAYVILPSQYPVVDAVSATISSADKTEIAQRAWDSAYVPVRSITQSAAQLAAIVTGSKVTIHRGDTITFSLTGLGSLAGRTALRFTVKLASDESEDDKTAILQVAETTGLITLNGSQTVTAGNASLVVDDATAGNITITLKNSTAFALPIVGALYDVQMSTATGTYTKTQSSFIVERDITRVL